MYQEAITKSLKCVPIQGLLGAASTFHYRLKSNWLNIPTNVRGRELNNGPATLNHCMKRPRDHVRLRLQRKNRESRAFSMQRNDYRQR